MQEGEKRSHWIWFVFTTAEGIWSRLSVAVLWYSSGNEECAYLAHPLLKAWLREITNIILQHSVKEVKEVMGSRIDALKFCSSMTLFNAVCPNDIF